MKGFVILFCFFSVLSCTNQTRQTLRENVIGDTPMLKDSIRYELFPVEKGYGFNILKNERIYVHQPIIPTWAGLQPFPTKETAEAIASLLTHKLQKQDFRFLLEKMEVDSLLKQDEADVFETEILQFHIFDSTTINRKLPPVHEKNKIEFLGNLFLLYSSPEKKKWRSIGIVPFGDRSGIFTFSIGNNVYTGGGEAKDMTTNDVWCYNTLTEAWTCLAEMPGGSRISGVAFAINQKGYIGLGAIRGGNSNTFKKELYQYNPRTNTWHQKKEFPGTPRVDAASFVIDDKAYVGLGYDENYCVDVYEYNPEKDSWKRVADFGGGPVSASIGINTETKGFILAGDRPPENKKFMYEYIPETNSWERRKDFPGNARYHLSAANIDNEKFIAGCGGAEGGTVRYRDFFLYDIAGNNWSSIPHYPVSESGISRTGAGTVHGKIYMGTGYNGDFFNDWNVFEYFFSVRKDTGDYNESVCYPMQYDGNWELFQECTSDDCFAGSAIRTKESLGDFCYGSRFVNTIRTVMLQDSGQVKKMFLFPRNHTLQTAKQPHNLISLRLFFTRNELEKSLQYCREKAGVIYNLPDLRVLQCNETYPDTEPSNNSFQKGSYTFITPKWYSYGVNDDIVVAEFSVSILRAEFYLVLPGN